MKNAVLLSALLLVATVAMAQTAPQSHFAAAASNQSAAMMGHAAASQNNDLRGCLSGSGDDYTLTDHQNKQHKVSGNDHKLWLDTGHEVDLTGKTNSSDVFQESHITDIASRCWNFKLN